MSGRGWKIFAAAAAVVIAAYQAIPDSSWWLTGWEVGIGYSGVAAILLGVRRLAVRDRVPWWCFAAGIFANATGIAVALYCTDHLGWVDMPTPEDWFFLCLYPGCAAGLGILIQRRDPWRNWTALVDATIITTGLGLLAWVYVIAPTTIGPHLSVPGHIVQVAYPIGDLLLLAMTTRLLRGGGMRGAPLWWISGSLAAFLVGDTAWVVLDRMGPLGGHLESLRPVTRGLDMVYLVAYVLFGVAALHSGVREIARAGSPRPARLSGPMLVLLAAVSLIAPAILAIQLHAGEVTDGPAVVIGCTALFLLVVTRMAQLLRQLERQAVQLGELSRQDELTGLLNRRAWKDELPRALEHARRDGTAVSVAMLDLDRFKLFNDSYGHPAGDRLLKEAAAAWHSALRQVDKLARYGGEEFIVLLPDADAERARQAIARALAVTPLGQTFSAGVAAWDGAETSEALILRADAALYAAKDAGRNRIVIAAWAELTTESGVAAPVSASAAAARTTAPR
jgi:diguanylate cyclase (GGDEF)-like protein